MSSDPVRRHIRLNIVGNEINNHHGTLSYERATGRGPDRTNAFRPIIDMARLGEEGLFTAMFLGDIAGSAGSPALDGGPPEPLTALTAVAAHTRRLGLIATASTQFYDPYNLARLIGSLDLISDGRAGFNAVTSASDAWALNYSRTVHPDREARYRRADEFLDVVTGLWDRREIRRDADGVERFYATALDHVGEQFQVAGPLNVAPSAQGRPVIAQAGGSGPGIAVAATHAEMVFTNATTIEQAAAYQADLDRALVTAGRVAGSVPIFPGLIPYLGPTRDHAEDLAKSLDGYVDYARLAPFALAPFGIHYEFDDLDDPFPTEVLPDPDTEAHAIKGVLGNYRGIYEWIAQRPGVTVRDVVGMSVVRGGSQHRKFVGSYDEFVDDMQHWLASGCVAGFNLMFPAGVLSLSDFVEAVVPRMIDRGIYRASPEQMTLRESLQN